MNKKLLYSLIASLSMASTGAFAAGENAVTTKAYVDGGLQYVYDVANGTRDGAVKTMQGTVQGLQTIVGAEGVGETPSSGLVGRMEAVEDELYDQTDGLVKKVNDLSTNNKTYTSGEGITVTAGANNTATVDLDLPKNQNQEIAAGTYVYTVDTTGTPGTWQALEMATTWSDSAIH